MSSEGNAFEELQRENEAKYDKYKIGIYQNVNSRRNNWSFVGDIVELYIPQIITVFLGAMGKRKDKK